MELDMGQLCIIGLLLLLPILYELSSYFKYQAKFIFYYATILLSGVIMIPIFMVRPGNVDNHRIASSFFRSVLKVFGIGMEVRGKENLKAERPCILVCNHQSSLDLIEKQNDYFEMRYSIGMMEIWPEQCTTLAKQELKYTGPFGLAAWLAGTVFIDRLNKEKAKDTMDATVKLLREKNIKLWVFPEGTRNHGGAMLPFKKGAFHLAVQAQALIIPVVFSSYSEFYSKREYRFGTGKFIITILPPVSTNGLDDSDVPDITEKVRGQMLSVFNQSSLETTHVKLSNGTRN